MPEGWPWDYGVCGQMGTEALVSTLAGESGREGVHVDRCGCLPEASLS